MICVFQSDKKKISSLSTWIDHPLCGGNLQMQGSRLAFFLSLLSGGIHFSVTLQATVYPRLFTGRIHGRHLAFGKLLTKQVLKNLWNCMMTQKKLRYAKIIWYDFCSKGGSLKSFWSTSPLQQSQKLFWAVYLQSSGSSSAGELL